MTDATVIVTAEKGQCPNCAETQDKSTLAKVMSVVLNPTTPIGHKAQGFLGCAFLFTAMNGGNLPDPVKASLKTVAMYLIGMSN